MTAPTGTKRKAAERARANTPAKKANQAPAKEAKEASAGSAKKAKEQRRSPAAERAYARRAQRVEEKKRPPRQPARGRRLRLRGPQSRASFVLLVMILLAAGVATTLLLSTQAIADSYRLEQIRQENENLAERAQQLQQDVAKDGSASSLAKRAQALGMVPAGEPAHLVQNPDGSVTVVGEPRKVTAPPPPPPPPPPATATTPTPPPGSPAGDTSPTDTPSTGNTPPAATPTAGNAQQGAPQADQQQAPDGAGH